MQKLVIAILMLTVIGAVGLGLYEANREDADDTSDVLNTTDATDVVVENLADPTAESEQFAEQLTAPTPTLAAQPTTEPTSEGLTMKGQTAATSEPVQQQESQENVGEIWQSTGIITSLNDFGFTLDNIYYIELGPPDFWQAQGVDLAVGTVVDVIGFDNGDQIHAREINVNEQQMTLRTASGQPLWSGGVTNENGQDNGENTENKTPLAEWETLTGRLQIVGNNNVSLLMADGTIYDLQMGQPRFWQNQGIELNDGDPIEIMGYWQNNRFRVGTLTKVMTQERLMILDPNGRPLWAGLGGNGNSDTPNADTNDTNTSATSDSGQGGGNGYRGGRN